MAGNRKSVLAADKPHWPENLSRKYRRLAIPAVVAAVSAKNAKRRKPASDAGDRRDTPGEEQGR